MKKLLIFLPALLLFFAQSGVAQFSVGVSAGTNLSNSIYQGFHYDTEGSTNYFAEVRPTYSFGKKWAISTGLQYSVKGHQDENFYNLGIVNATQYHYFDILPTVEYRLVKGLSVFGGMNTGILLKERYRVFDNWETARANLMNPLDIGALAGLKVSYKNFFVSAHYNRSVISASASDIVYTDDIGTELPGVKQLNQNVQVGVGYVFR
jgi:hypothetical protein